MSLKFIYTNVDGTVSIVHAVPKEHLERIFPNMTDEEYRAHVLERSIPVGATNVRELTEADIPTSREFRDAWVDVTPSSKVDISMAKVKDILLKKVRATRGEKLAKSDSLVSRAIEQGKDLTKLKAARQALRDSTNNLKAVAVDSVVDVNSQTKLNELVAAANVVMVDPVLD